MNDFRIGLNSHFIFDGFTVQPGMLYGRDNAGRPVITNGKPWKDGYWIYIRLDNLDGEFEQIHITQKSYPQIYHKIQKALRRRERKNIDGVSYRTPAQLEAERWNSDFEFKRQCTPIGKTPKVKGAVNEHSAMRYNAIKERNTLTQDISLCIYNAPRGQAVVV